MSARERIAERLWWSVPSSDDADAKAKASAMLDAFRAEVLNEAANGLAALGLVDSLVSGSQAWTEAIETLRRMAAAGQAPSPYDHGTGGSPCADCGHDWFMHRHEDGTCRVCSCERYSRPAPAPQPESRPDTDDHLAQVCPWWSCHLTEPHPAHMGCLGIEQPAAPQPRRLDEDGRCRHCRRTTGQCDATGCGGRHDPYSSPWSAPKPGAAS